jgi:PAS domain S-box-containing protein
VNHPVGRTERESQEIAVKDGATTPNESRIAEVARSESEAALQEWRTRTLYLVLIVIAVLGLPSYAFTIWNAVRSGQMPAPLLWVYLLAYLTFVGLAAFPRFDARLRGWLFLLLAYANACASFARVGLAGSGRLYLIALPVIAILVVGARAGYVTAVLSLAIYVAFAALAHLGLLENRLVVEATPLDLSFWVEAGTALTVFVVLLVVLLERFYQLQVRTLAAKHETSAELAQTAQVLKEREERLAAAMEVINDGIWDWDIQTNEVYYSPRWKRILGYADHEIANRFEEWQRRLHPDDVELAMAEVQAHLEGRTPIFQLEHRLQHRDGSYRSILARGIAFRDADGKPHRMAGSHTDVTERRQAEEALRESEGNMRSLMENARNSAVYRVALDPSNPYLARVLVASPSMHDLFGVPDLQDFSSWFDPIHPDDRPRIVEANRRSLETGVPFDQQMRFFNNERGEWTWARVVSTPMFDAEGRLTHFNGLIVDITKQKQAEQTLQRRLAFEELVASISSEFVNLGPDEVDAGIQHALKLIGEFDGADRGYVFLLSGDGTAMTNTHEWCAEGVEPFIDRVQDVSLSTFPWLMERLGRLDAVRVPRVADLPPEATVERTEFQAQAIQSLLCVPMTYRGTLIGFIGFDAVQGERTWTEDSAALLRMAGEIFVNALEHKRAQRALRESEEKFRGIVEYANVGIAIVQDARFQFVNPHYADMLGYTAQEMLHTEFMGYCAPEERERIVDLHSRRMRGESAPAQYETVIMHKDGSRVYVDVGVGSIQYAGQPATFVFLRDITKQREAQEALQTAYESLERRVEERTRELAAINAVSAVVSRSLDLQGVAGDALDKILEVMEMDLGVAYRLAGDLDEPPERLALSTLAYRGISAELARSVELLPLRHSFVERAAAAGRPVVWLVADYPEGPRKQALEREGVHVGVSVPLLAKGQLVGAIVLGARGARSFAPEELSLLAAVGQQVGMAVENAHLYETEQERYVEVERRRQVAEGLREILTVLNSTRSLDEMLAYVVAQASQLLNSDAALFCRLDQQSGMLAVQASHGLDAETAAGLAFRVGTGSTVGQAVLARQPVATSDLAAPVAQAGVPAEWGESLERFTARYRAALAVPLVLKDEVYGAIVLYYQSTREFSDEDVNLAVTVADQAALAVENARLQEQAGQTAAMAERSRLARELHDSVTQSLYSVTMYAEAAARVLAAGQETTAVEYLRDARDTAQEALREMRLLIYQLRPPVLEKGGLVAALQARLDGVERRGGIQATLEVRGEERLPSAVQTELYHVAQEALNNALKHARAQHVQVVLQFDETGVGLQVQDDGAGFDPATARERGGMGIPGMEERMHKLGGSLQIESVRGQGTKVSARVSTGGGS